MSLLQRLFQKFSLISEPLRFGNDVIIIYRGIKISKKKISGKYKITVEDTSFDHYSPIENSIIIEALIRYADRQEKAFQTEKDCSTMG